VTVAAKTHYFCELDMVETVKNLINACPGFWTSEPWRACLESGDFLELDPSWFHQVGRKTAEFDSRSQVRLLVYMNDSMSK
jgi:hypothetical protein